MIMRWINAYVMKVILYSIICVPCHGVEMGHVQRVLERDVIHVRRIAESATKNPPVEMASVLLPLERIVPHALGIAERVLPHPLLSIVGTTSVITAKTVIRVVRIVPSVLHPLRYVEMDPVLLERTVGRALEIVVRVHLQTPIAATEHATPGKIVTLVQQTVGRVHTTQVVAMEHAMPTKAV